VSNTSPSFGFGSVSNPIQTSTAPVVSASSFSFAPPSSTVPVFGASPSALSSTFSFGTTPAVPVNPTLFQFSGAASTPISSDSPVDSSNPYSVTSDQTPAKRPMLKARRQRHP